MPVARPGGVRWPRALWAGAVGTCLTHPALWFLWPRVVHGYAAMIVSGELPAATLESLTFFACARPLPLRRSVAASFLANAAGYGLGLLLPLETLLR